VIGRRTSRPRATARGVRRPAAALLTLLAAGCAARAASGPPLEDPAGAAHDLALASVPSNPAHLRFHWEYSDRRGPTRGEGVGRYNPPDSLRLDLFGVGDASMAVALTGDGLRALGQLENVQLPPPAFLYATAGLFDPPGGPPARGFRTEDGEVLVYDVPDGIERRYVVRGDRLVRVEDVRDGRTIRRLEISWPNGAATWPSGAEYRDLVTPSGAKWSLDEVTMHDESYPADIFDLPIRG
jgi:hypothetical protein